MIRIWATIGLLLASQAPMIGLAPAAPVLAQLDLLPSAGGPTLTPNYRDAVYGDFLQVGNTVLRCPVAGEETGGNSAQDCVAATENRTPGGLLDNRSNNNGYYMHMADDDGRTDTFNSSRAELTIPDGATVRYAQLHWGGHTGTFVGFSGVNCTRPILLQGQPPPPPAKATAAEQDVTLAVAGTEPAAVPRVAGNYRATQGLAEPSEIYMSWADVTGWFASVPTGEIVQVSVGNVWAPTGPGCAGGWSLVVVFGYDEPTEPDYTALRVVDLYTDGLPKGGALLPGIIEPLLPGFPSIIDGLLPGLLPNLTGSAVTLPGLNPRRSSAGVVIGVTAYDGDWNQGGETLSVDGTAIVDPCLNDGTEDFFRSCANGSIDPIDPSKPYPQNNLSVESKTFMPELEDNDTGEIELRVDGVADFFVLHNVVLAENVEPSISIVNNGPDSVLQGDLATFDIEVTNDGSLPLYDIELVDTSDPATDVLCTPATVQPLDPGQSRMVTCVQPAVGDTEFTNTATVTATFLTPAGGGAPRTVTASDSATVQVTPADYAVQRVPDKLVTHVGEPVTFTVTLFNNTTDVTLTELVYTDHEDAECDGPEPDAVLGPESQLTFECVVPSPQETFVSYGELTATTGPMIVTVRSADITIVVIEPVLAVSQVVDKDTIYRGDSVTITFTVENLAEDPEEILSGVTVTVADLPDCEPEPIEELAAGEAVEVSCTVRPIETVDVVATAEGTDVTDQPATATSDPTRITVLDPLLEITQDADRPTIRVEGEVEFTFTVTHIGDDEDGPLTEVQIRNATIPPDCEPEVIEQLDPGESETRSCRAKPDRSFDSIATATAVDQLDRPMEVVSEPLRITVINPVMTITTTADPEKAKHGASVNFDVLVRNIGDVPLTFEVSNDQAQDCDFEVTDEDSLPAGAAQGRRCTTKTPTEEDEEEFTNVASFSALPIEEIGDDGDPITGEDDATIELLAGQAPPEPTPNPGSGNGGSGNGGNGSGNGSGSGNQGGSGDGQGLAVTGASLAVPVVLAGSLIVAGLVLSVAARRPEEDDDGFLARWWPTN